MRWGRHRAAGVVAAVLALAVLAGCAGTGGVNQARLSPEDVTASSAGPKNTHASRASSVKRDIEKLTASATPGSTGYKVGPQDILEISVFKVPELSKKVEVAAEGTINLPLVGEVHASGLTTRQIEHNVTKLLGQKYLQNPQVTILVAEYNSQRVTIEGAVKKPGVYPIKGQLTLLQSIAVAQGLERNADTSVLVFRKKGGRRAAARFELDEIRSGQVRDPRLAAGDVVVVKTSFSKEAFDNVLRIVPLARVFVLF
jgi:polysaccharide biosynthesis/export protein